MRSSRLDHCLLPLVLLLFLLAQDAGGQEPTAPEEPPATDAAGEPAIQDAESAVDVIEQVDDASIEARLERILQSAGRYDAVELNVDSGVVFVTGLVRQTDHAEWITNLARRTEGVVAVVNDVEVRRRALWDLGPATEELRAIGEQAVRLLPALVLAMLLLGLTLLGARTGAGWLARILLRRVETRILRDVLEKTILVLLVVAGIYLALRVSGLTRIAVTIIGGTGVAGIVLGFAFRDIAENFLASLLISIQRPFRVGDAIEVDGHTGLVQRVTTRGTVLMDFDGNHIQIANATVYKSTIRNYTANPTIRLDFGVGIGFDASVSKAQATILGVLSAHSAVLAEPQPQVLVEELGSATIRLRAYCWTNGSIFGKLRVRSALMRLTVRALTEAGVSMPDEAREVVFPESVPIRLLDRDESRAAAAARPDSTLEEEAVENTAGEGDLSNDASVLAAHARMARDPEETPDVF
ncbi:MAG: mechanosensitive ion channel family protein [Planctomycetota bacterium]